MKLIPDDVIQSKWEIPRIGRFLKIFGATLLIVVVIGAIVSYTAKPGAGDVAGSTASSSESAVRPSTTVAASSTSAPVVTPADKQRLFDAMQKKAQ